MPAIRDYTFAFESVTTDSGINIPMCSFQQNDLLLVFAMGDTGAPTWGCSNGSGSWTQLFAQNNTCSTVCFWKIAGVTEADIVVTSTVNETYNGCVIAIRDVNTTNPFGNPSVFNNAAQAAANRFAMQQITTNVNDALVIYMSANSGTGVPSFIEGRATGLIGADGSAESLGVGWIFQKTAGLTPNDIFCSNVATGAGVRAAIQIAPPGGGAQVIPPYLAADASVLLDYINGTTGYNTNTALAATADTNFGASLGGITANDGTVAASADVGINSFHSFGRITNSATANQISGAELILAAANRFNFSARNLLTHIRPQSPGQYQRLTSIASSRGVWMGVRSNVGSGGATTGYKIWRVHGVGTNWGLDNKIPVIINNGAGNTVAVSGTLDAAVITSVGFWVGGIGVLQAGIEFGMLWLMDVVTVVGGNSTEPLTIPGIVDVTALGHERLSAIQQGSSQMLCLMDLQIGDGGTNPVFLDLNSTAIEFPRQYNVASGDVYYNSVNDKVGITYYAGSADTIKHRNSVISSASRYKWGLHPSSSLSASYDFSGTAVIGAGAIALNRAITLTGLTINDYLTLDASGLTLNNSTITAVPATNDSLTVNSSTVFNNCTINVSTVTSGNRWVSVATPSIFTNCKFTGGGGHAIRITTPGTYSFIGNTFTGFGADGSNGAAIFNDSGGAVTINVSGGGTTPTIRNGAGASTTVNSNVQITLTGLVNPSEVRVFNAGTSTEIAGQENVTTGSFVFSVGSGVAVDISILSLAYQIQRIKNYSTTSDTSLPVQQVVDRQYLNP